MKKLPSVEALGSVNVICSDKTGKSATRMIKAREVDFLAGTLTKNEQTVMEMYTVDEIIMLDTGALRHPLTPALEKVLQLGSVCNNARRNESGLFIGQSTDVALLNVLERFGMADERTVRSPRTNANHRYLNLFPLEFPTFDRKTIQLGAKVHGSKRDT